MVVDRTRSLNLFEIGTCDLKCVERLGGSIQKEITCFHYVIRDNVLIRSERTGPYSPNTFPRCRLHIF